MAKKSRSKMRNHPWAEGFGRRVRELRTAAELSQAQLAKRAKLHPTYVGSVERSEKFPTLAVVEDLASALGCQPIELFMPPQIVSASGKRPKKEDLEQKFLSLFRRADNATYWMLQVALDMISHYQNRK